MNKHNDLKLGLMLLGIIILIIIMIITSCSEPCVQLVEGNFWDYNAYIDSLNNNN